MDLCCRRSRGGQPQSRHSPSLAHVLLWTFLCWCALEVYVGLNTGYLWASRLPLQLGVHFSWVGRGWEWGALGAPQVVGEPTQPARLEGAAELN